MLLVSGPAPRCEVGMRSGEIIAKWNYGVCVAYIIKAVDFIKDGGTNG